MMPMMLLRPEREAERGGGREAEVRPVAGQTEEGLVATLPWTGVAFFWSPTFLLSNWF